MSGDRYAQARDGVERFLSRWRETHEAHPNATLVGISSAEDTTAWLTPDMLEELLAGPAEMRAQCSGNLGRVVTGTYARTLTPGTRVVRVEPDTEIPAVMARVLAVAEPGSDNSHLDRGGPYLVVHEPDPEPIVVGATLRSLDALGRVPIGTTLETGGGAIVTYEGNGRFAYTGMSERQPASQAWLPATVLLIRKTADS